ncbi:DivIVA domain-containing protein [bacterium]|nr:DivIVA domain-containing protein [bacterium]
MRLTPLDIQQREFKKSFRGYDSDDVDEFLNKVHSEYESLYSENRSLKEQTFKIQEEIKRFIEMEKTLKSAIVNAERSAQDMRKNAKKESELILKEAELNSEKIIEDSRLEAKDIMVDIKKLAQQKEMMRIDIIACIDKYYEMLELPKKNKKRRK